MTIDKTKIELLQQYTGQLHHSYVKALVGIPQALKYIEY
jgi:hypothetical protein